MPPRESVNVSSILAGEYSERCGKDNRQNFAKSTLGETPFLDRRQRGKQPGSICGFCVAVEANFVGARALRRIREQSFGLAKDVVVVTLGAVRTAALLQPGDGIVQHGGGIL